MVQVDLEFIPSQDKTTEAWKEYHQNNPEVYRMFCRFAFEAIRAGRAHYSANSIVERIRWETDITGGEDFKIANAHSSYYSRLFMDDYPEHEGFFRKTKSKADKLFPSETSAPALGERISTPVRVHHNPGPAFNYELNL